MRDTLPGRAARRGILVRWTDAQGNAQRLSARTLEGLLHALPPEQEQDASCFVLAPRAPLPAHGARHALDERGDRVPLPDGRAPAQPGYYTWRRGARDVMLAVAPPRCFGLHDAVGGTPRLWGIAAQVYGLKRQGDGGLGDSRAVSELAAQVGAAGGDALAISPLHASAPVVAGHSPYAPSHRAWLDWMQTDPAIVFGEDALRDTIRHAGAAEAWQRAERARLIDWRAQYALRRRVYWQLFERHGERAPAIDALRRFMRRGGPALRMHAAFATYQQWQAEQGGDTDWRTWREPRGVEAAVRAFARSHPPRVAFEGFLQWLAAACWEHAQQQARQAGQRMGLIWDLAVGFLPGGSEAWQYRDLLVEGAQLGAPPDAFNAQGQAWGLAAYAPQGLRRSGFRPFIELLRAMMARGGGVRIDHILGWSRAWLVPAGLPASEGGYVRYPLRELLGLLALESWRHRCVVIGEDLGTVPAGLRHTLARHGVLGLDVLLFTRDAQGGFTDPAHWREAAVAMSTTHDLPPLTGWREGVDLDVLARAQQWPPLAHRRALAERRRDARALDRAAGRRDAPVRNALRLTLRAASPLVLLPLEDVLERREPPNVPGTVHEHPNWRRRLRWQGVRLREALDWFARERSLA
ncbi:4-alpha-glucanotransferase [Dyella sp. BiH032]|uniref:4-alpha-glucanotransferase n=1 Tax=Dyella sp. BiH032 TaxID=3075430 RepID=UPI0028931CCF|nr:4-alpha-glucanotransferase [Dyella sp. BiH032]WNL44138.1 4-alpha-glucanotransferase [Dyella sp. BiH032]